MTYRETMKALKAAGTAQNRKIYGNHGVTGEVFGVSYAELGKLKKKIKRDQKLAEQL
ncbi:MAG: DNA alkylation repair protein, partial [Gemmatimonadetes bacterium]|nr:DNA alkylation repair protein [Gemmatimonadota bacterium]